MGGATLHWSLVLTSPGSDGDIVSALWVYIRHYGDQRPVSGSVTLRCKMGHSVATCKYQDSSSVLPSQSVGGILWHLVPS